MGRDFRYLCISLIFLLSLLNISFSEVINEPSQRITVVFDREFNPIEDGLYFLSHTDSHKIYFDYTFKEVLFGDIIYYSYILTPRSFYENNNYYDLYFTAKSLISNETVKNPIKRNYYVDFGRNEIYLDTPKPVDVNSHIGYKEYIGFVSKTSQDIFFSTRLYTDSCKVVDYSFINHYLEYMPNFDSIKYEKLNKINETYFSYNLDVEKRDSFFVICEDVFGNVDFSKVKINLIEDDFDCDFDIIPYLISDYEINEDFPPQAIIKCADYAYCKYDIDKGEDFESLSYDLSETTDFFSNEYYSNLNEFISMVLDSGAQDSDYDIHLSCMNKAGDVTDVFKKRVSFEYEIENRIVEVNPPSDSLVQDNDLYLSVLLNRKPTSCRILKNDSEIYLSQKNVPYLLDNQYDLISLDDGYNELAISCEFNNFYDPNPLNSTLIYYYDPEFYKPNFKIRFLNDNPYFCDSYMSAYPEIEINYPEVQTHAFLISLYKVADDRKLEFLNNYTFIDQSSFRIPIPIVSGDLVEFLISVRAQLIDKNSKEINLNTFSQPKTYTFYYSRDKDKCDVIDYCGDSVCLEDELCQNNTCVKKCTDSCSSLGLDCGSHLICGKQVNCGFCTDSTVCNSKGLCVADCTDSCSSLGFDCGSHLICGEFVNCGNCLNSTVCNSNGLCVDNCTDSCSSLGFDCGTHLICDNDVDCGSCYFGKLCNNDQGLCEYKQECIKTNDCLEGQVCYDNLCSDSCGDSNDCSDYHICLEGACFFIAPSSCGDDVCDDEEHLYNCELDCNFLDNLDKCPVDDLDNLDWRELKQLCHILDSDDDGLPDWWELLHFECRTCANPDDDPDIDGLTNYEEFILGTNPNNSDSDNDGFLDYDELISGTDPLKKEDYSKSLSLETDTNYFLSILPIIFAIFLIISFFGLILFFVYKKDKDKKPNKQISVPKYVSETKKIPEKKKKKISHIRKQKKDIKQNLINEISLLSQSFGDDVLSSDDLQYLTTNLKSDNSNLLDSLSSIIGESKKDIENLKAEKNKQTKNQDIDSKKNEVFSNLDSDISNLDKRKLKKEIDDLIINLKDDNDPKKKDLNDLEIIASPEVKDLDKNLINLDKTSKLNKRKLDYTIPFDSNIKSSKSDDEDNLDNLNKILGNKKEVKTNNLDNVSKNNNFSSKDKKIIPEKNENQIKTNNKNEKPDDFVDLSKLKNLKKQLKDKDNDENKDDYFDMLSKIK